MHSIKKGDRQFRDDSCYSEGSKGVLAMFLQAQSARELNKHKWS